MRTPDEYTMALSMTRPTQDARGVWQIRRKVPEELRGVLGRREWKRSLGTRDPAEAKRRAVLVLQECEQAFSLARSIFTGTPQITAPDAQQIAARWFREELATLEASGDYRHYLAVSWSDEPDPNTGEPIGEVADSLQSVLPSEASEDRRRVTAPFIKAALAAYQLPAAPEGSPTEELLTESFWAHVCGLSNLCLARFNARGRYVPPPTVTPAAPLSFEMSGQPKLSLSEVFSKWADDKRQNDGQKRSTEKNISEFETVVSRFIELFGDKPVAEITRPLCQEFKAALGSLPTKGEGLRGLSAPEAIARAKAEHLPTASVATIRKQLRALSAVLNFAVQRLGAMSEEPISASGIFRSLSKAARRAETRSREDKAYSRQELRQIFNSPLFHRKWSPPRADYGEALYWLPLLMVYHGGRREELAQLSAEDVRRCNDSGIWYLSLRPDEEKTVKAANSRRRVPLHPDIVALGFLDYVVALPDSGQLFPKLKPHKANGYGHAVGSAWAKYLRNQVGLDTEADPSHGFRHAFKTMAREVGIPEEVSHWITGHHAPNEGSKYGSNPLVRMAEELRKLPSVARIAGLLPEVSESSAKRE